MVVREEVVHVFRMGGGSIFFHAFGVSMIVCVYNLCQKIEKNDCVRVVE